MPPDLDASLTARYVLADDLLPRRRGRGRPPRISDAEIVCLAVAQIFLDRPKERSFLRMARRRLGHLFPYLPGQPGYNKRVRALAPQIAELVTTLARLSPSFCDRLRLLDSTPVPCAASRETVKRSQLAGYAAYGYCASHSRFFWGFRLYLLCAPDGMPVAFELAPANAPEREVAAELLERALEPGQTLLCDKGFAGEEFEQIVSSYGATLLRPDRADEEPRFGSLGRVRQWIESIIHTGKDQLSLEEHGARTLERASLPSPALTGSGWRCRTPRASCASGATRRWRRRRSVSSRGRSARCRRSSGAGSESSSGRRVARPTSSRSRGKHCEAGSERARRPVSRAGRARLRRRSRGARAADLAAGHLADADAAQAAAAAADRGSG